MTSQPWWRTTTIYQIYPRSYADSNGDGIGDLQGIITKLDYIRDLGFETIWISPFFASPQKDFGYDISGYQEIAPEYGTMADVEELIQQVHGRGMKVLFDLVLNHTSDQHPWFLESRSNRDNPKRDWYIWRSSPSPRGRGARGEGRPPNNWKAIPGGSAWHYDEVTDQYYFANFLPFQPDLNWRNPEVKQAMLDNVRFWLDKGVDGFRLDIFHSIYKDDQFRNNPFSSKYLPEEGEAGFFQQFKYTLNRPETFQLARELRAILDSYSPPRMMVGEVFGADETVKRYIGDDLDGFHFLFQWGLINFKPKAAFFRKVIQDYEAQYPEPYIPVYVFGNHDRKRLISQINADTRLAKLLALFQYTVRGVPVTYYGEEIGMTDGNFPAKTALDPVGRRYAWLPPKLVDILGLYVNRDGCRTPMQWDSGPNAGFCPDDVAPWLPVQENRKTANVADQLDAKESLLNLYRELLHLRRDNPALRMGTLELVADSAMDGSESGDILAYQRKGQDQTLLVAINFGVRFVPLPRSREYSQVLIAVGVEPDPQLENLHLPPKSGLILSTSSGIDI